MYSKHFKTYATLGTENTPNHTKQRQALVLSTDNSAYNFNRSTDDEEMEEIRDWMIDHKSRGLLLMWLQSLHLWQLLRWKDTDFNGNIFKWLKYEHKGATGYPNPMHEEFKAILGWDGTSEKGTPGGVQFFELGTTPPVKYDKRSDGETGIYHYSKEEPWKGMHGVTTLDGAHGWDPNWYAWGPQWSNERGFYYIAGKPGDQYVPRSQFIGGDE
jgi:hypothetical protein